MKKDALPHQLETLLLAVIDAARDTTGADFGNIQLIDKESGNLLIVAQRGFSDEWLHYWNTKTTRRGSCGSALQIRKRVTVEDVSKSPIFAGTDALEVQIRAGVRAVQSTPLLSSSGDPVGIFSTHYRNHWQPTSNTLNALDALAARAALAIERVHAV